MIVVYLIVIWFTILLFSNKNYFMCSAVILSVSLLNIIAIDVMGLTESMTFIEEVGLLIKVDGVTAVLIMALCDKERLADTMLCLLAFSISCHTMIIYDLIVVETGLTSFVYAWYNELIMSIGIIQMAICRNGINSALRNIRHYILRLSFYTWYYIKISLKTKAREVRT